MKKLLLLLVLPICLHAQQADWTWYGPTFFYDNGKVLNKGLAVNNITDMQFRSDSAMVLSSFDDGIFVLKKNVAYGLGNVVFAKEGAKLSLIKGGQTKGATSMLLDSQGNLWFTSDKGLHRIDAIHLSDLQKMSKQSIIEGKRFGLETPGLEMNNCSKVRQGKNGLIWVSGRNTATSEHKGLSSFNGQEWRNYQITGFEKSEVLDFKLDDQGNPVAIIRGNAGGYSIVWFQGGEWKDLKNVDEKSRPVALTFVNNTLHVATESQLFNWSNAAWQKVPLVNKVSFISALEGDNAGSLWVGFDGGALCLKSNGAECVLASYESPMPAAEIRTIAVDQNGKKWFNTNAGILGYKESTLLTDEGMTRYTPASHNYPKGTVQSMLNFNNELYLVTEEKGLYKFDGRNFSWCGLPNLQELYYGAPATDGSNIYIPTLRYLHKYDGKTYSKWEWQGLSKQVNTVLVDNDKTVWIGFDGVSKYNDGKWVNYNKAEGLMSSTITKLFYDSKRNIWAVMNNAVAKYDGSAWTSFTKKQTGVTLSNVTAMAESRDGIIYFSNGFSVVKYDGTTFSEIAQLKGAGKVRSMVVANDGTLLIATTELGLAKIKDGATSFCNEYTCKLPSKVIASLYKSDDGKIWVAFGLPDPVPAWNPQAQQPAPQESPSDAFLKKIKEVDGKYALVELKKW